MFCVKNNIIHYRSWGSVLMCSELRYSSRTTARSPFASLTLWEFLEFRVLPERKAFVSRSIFQASKSIKTSSSLSAIRAHLNRTLLKILKTTPRTLCVGLWNDITCFFKALVCENLIQLESILHQPLVTPPTDFAHVIFYSSFSGSYR